MGKKHPFLEYNFLVIDDEVEIVNALYRQFRRKYNVFKATSAEEALNILDNNKIEVILSDQRMPGMTGVELFSKIRTEFEDTTKIILTGFADIKAVIRAINDGQIFRYVSKPWDPEELDTIIREAFEKTALITENRVLLEKLRLANADLENKVEIRTRELVDANEKLLALNNEKNKYIGIVAHDLVSPIGLAGGYAGLILDNVNKYNQETILKFSKRIKHICDHSVELIKDVLDISKIEAGSFELEIAKHNYRQFLTDFVELNAPLAENKKISINYTTGPDLFVVFDDTKINQVLTNLFSNAIKYSNPNTSISINYYTEGDRVYTIIRDEGQGIPENEIDGIFEAFRTTSVKPTANEKSTGLGLAIVKRIVEAHQGKIEVLSKPGEGTSMSFYLPTNL